MIKLALVMGVALGLSACATAPRSNNYQAYLNTVQSIETSKAIAETQSMGNSYDDLLARCSSDACVASVASYKAIADVTRSLAGGGGGSSSIRVAAPPREETFGDKALAWAGILVPGVTTYASITEGGRTSRHISDNNAEVQVSQNESYASIINGQSRAWSGAIGAATSTPRIVVGGNYGDTQTTTNTAGTNLISGDGNVVGNRNGNSGRQDSPGPFDNSGNCRDGDANCPVDNGGG